MELPTTVYNTKEVKILLREICAIFKFNFIDISHQYVNFSFHSVGIVEICQKNQKNFSLEGERFRGRKEKIVDIFFRKKTEFCFEKHVLVKKYQKKFNMHFAALFPFFHLGKNQVFKQ